MRKRKYSDINKDLTIKAPFYLLCKICSKKVYGFELCTSPFTYCSSDCLEVLILSQKNDYLDTKDKNDKMEEDKPVGMQYLKWLCDQDWFKHREIVQQIINDTVGDNIKQEEILEEIKKPKIKQTEKKVKNKCKESTVKISTENNVLEFQ